MQLTQPNDVFLMIAAWEWGKYHGDKMLKLCVSSYQRPNPNSLKVEAKVTGHYVNSILAAQEARDKGYDEALLLDVDGFVAEEKPVLDAELQQIQSEIVRQKTETVLNKEKADLIAKKFRDLGFRYVTLDLHGFRSGAMNEVLK